MATSAKDVRNVPELQYLTHEEALEVFDSRARRRLDISGEEFLRRWKAGEYDDSDDDADVVSVTVLLPLIGEESWPRQESEAIGPEEDLPAAPQLEGSVNDELFSEERGVEIFDARARHYFGVSGPEWVKRWKSGQYDHIGDERHYMAMLFSLPLVGENPWQR